MQRLTWPCVDLYLTHAELNALARSFPQNKLLQGRGQPGTHDVALGHRCLASLRRINDSSRTTDDPPLQLPVFDKSQHGGEGDRSEETVAVRAPLDVVLFEGWCLGFAPLGAPALRQAYEHGQQQAGAAGEGHGRFFLQHSIESLLEIDERLRAYESEWHSQLDAFVQLRPVDPALLPADDRGKKSGAGTGRDADADADADAAAGLAGLANVFRWRLEAEHGMKACNGGRGMSDDEVRRFVERYMPGYELWGGGVTARERAWHSHGLRIDIGPAREVVGVSHF